jgi:galactokinase
VPGKLALSPVKPTTAPGGAPAKTANDSFRDLVGAGPEGLWRAPGRVNLIGEHTDYNFGLALPFAIDRATVVAAGRRADNVVRVMSCTLGSQAAVRLDDIAKQALLNVEPWARYPFGVIWAMLQAGVKVPGLDLVISSDIPIGSGLSSSAALTVSVAIAVNDIAEAALSDIELARTAQQAESEVVGMPCGLLDPLAALEGRPGAGVLIDFLSLNTEPVPVGSGPFVVINTRVEHANASGGYADRRAACEKAAQQLGLPSLREATLAQVEENLTGELLKRARHVVTEDARVVDATARLRANQPIGDLLSSSHRSLRDDYEVSCPELDVAVEVAIANGAEGARLTGAGFGGCAISLGVSADEITAPMLKAFESAGFVQPEVFGVAPMGGAGRLA